MSSFRDKIRQAIQDKDATDFELDQQEKEMPDSELELFTPSPFFGVESTRNSPATLELRLASGISRAYPYSYILEFKFDPSEGIEIISTTKRILITGRNLKQGYLMLTSFRVKWIEANKGNDLTEEGKLFVKDIRIEEV